MEDFRNIQKELKERIDLIESLEFEREEIGIALRERDSLIHSLQDNLSKAANNSSVSTENLKRKIEELKKVVGHQKEELENWKQKFRQAETSFEKAYEQLKMKNASYVIQLKDLKEKSEGHKSYTGDTSQTDMSMKKRSDLIRLENELRQKNSYIDSLKESMRNVQKISIKPIPGPNSFSKKGLSVPLKYNLPVDLKAKLIEKERLKSNR